MVRPTRGIHRYTYEAYLENEASSNVKHEFLDGEIYAMAGGTLEHAAIAVNVGAALAAQLRDRPCVVASSDLKVRALATGLATYPDVTVVCGTPELDPKGRDVLLNPTVVVEVTSDSSEEWDRGEKLQHYQQIPSLVACVLVSHRACLVEVVERAGDGWETRVAGPGEVAAIAALGCALAVDEVYRNVAVPA